MPKAIDTKTSVTTALALSLFGFGSSRIVQAATATNQLSPLFVAEQKVEKPLVSPNAEQIRKQIVLSQLTLSIKTHDIIYRTKEELSTALEAGEKNKALTLSEKLQTYEGDYKELNQDLLAHFKDLALKDKIDIIKNTITPALKKTVQNAEAAAAAKDKKETDRSVAGAHHLRGILDKLNESVKDAPLHADENAERLRQQIKETEDAIKKLMLEMRFREGIKRSA